MGEFCSEVAFLTFRGTMSLSHFPCGWGVPLRCAEKRRGLLGFVEARRGSSRLTQSAWIETRQSTFACLRTSSFSLIRLAECRQTDISFLKTACQHAEVIYDGYHPVIFEALSRSPDSHASFALWNGLDMRTFTFRRLHATQTDYSSRNSRKHCA